MNLKHLTLLFSCVICCLLPAQSPGASLYYILDGSGSMWGRVDNEMKIVAAKRVMNQLIDQMPPEVHSGLTVYGHRRKGDCNDIVELIPLGPLDKDNAARAVQAIKPKGKTPIAATIKRVAASLQGNEDETTIVLVSDGIETCGGDPCLITRKLKEAGIRFIIHTVGLDVDKKASDQLKCVAMEGGGNYFMVNNAAELLQTLSSVQESVVNKAPAPVPEPAPEPVKIEQKVSSSSSSLRLKINKPGRISFTAPGWLKPPYYWELLDPETGESKGRFNSLETTVVPVGEYQVAWKQSEHDSSTVVLAEIVTVERGKESVVPLLTSLQLNLPSWTQRPYYWKLIDPETKETVFQTNLLEPCLVPAGEYTLLWRQSEHGAQDTTLATINIEPDKLNSIALSTALNPVPADWIQPRIRYWQLRKTDANGTEQTVAHFADTFGPQLAPAGTYQLYYRLSEHGTSDSLLGEVSITEGEMNEFAVNTGAAFILPPGTAPPYLMEFIHLDANGKEGDKVSLRGGYLGKEFGPIALSPGTYKINYRQKQHGTSTITIVDSFDLPQGNLVEIEL